MFLRLLNHLIYILIFFNSQLKKRQVLGAILFYGLAYLIFVNGLGPNYKGDNMYEFIFSNNIKDIWDDSWEAKPANGYPKPPKLEFIKKVGVLK